MTLLREVSTSPDFELVGAENRKRARAACDKGIDFVLESQIVVNGRLTAWPQQADEKTYEPRPARAFEPVAISGGESASVLHMLMDVPKPSPEAIAAVEAGVQWYRDNDHGNAFGVPTLFAPKPERRAPEVPRYDRWRTPGLPWHPEGSCLQLGRTTLSSA